MWGTIMDKKTCFTAETIQTRLSANPFAKLSDIVLDIIQEAIINLDILPGEKINMTAIAESLNVSRAPVREAISALVKEGFVVEKPNVNGYYALDISDKYMAEFFVARSTIEVAAIRICAARFHSIDCRHLKECCDVFRRCYKTNDYEAFVAADRDFHGSLVQYTGNSFLINMYASLNRTIAHYYSLSRYYLKNYGSRDIFNDFELLINEHLAMYNAIRTGLVDCAASTAQRHLDTCYSSFVHYYLTKGVR